MREIATEKHEGNVEKTEREDRPWDVEDVPGDARTSGRGGTGVG